MPNDIIHGDLYQLKLLMLFLYRGITRNYSFRLGTEIDEAKKFDDLVFEYTVGDKKFYRLLQSKHCLNETSKIEADGLLTDNDSDYSLIKYFFSYHNLKKEALFEQGIIKDVTVCTNINFNFNNLQKNGFILERFESPDDILDIHSSRADRTKKNPIRYRFHKDTISILLPRIKSYCMKVLAKYLVTAIMTKNMITVQNDVMKVYHKALVQEVIDVKNKIFYANFLENKDLSTWAKEFRSAFHLEIEQQSNNQLNLTDLNENLQAKHNKIRLVLRSDFIKGSKGSYCEVLNIDENAVSEYLDHLVFAVQQPNEEELGKAIQEELKIRFHDELTSDHVYNKLFNCMLNLLQRKNEYKIKRFHTSEEGIELINNARKEILAIIPDFKDHLDNNPFQFDSTDDLEKFISASKNLWLLQSETPELSSLFLHQLVKKGDYKFSYYNFKWENLLQNGGKYLPGFQNLADFLMVVTCFETSCSEKGVHTLCDKFNEIASVGDISSERLIVIAPESHKFMEYLKRKFPSHYKEELKVEFASLDDASQNQLLDKKYIKLFGNCKSSSLSELFCSNEKGLAENEVKALNIDASALEILFKYADEEISDELDVITDFDSKNFKTNTTVELNELKVAIASNEDDIFAFVGDQSISKELKLSFEIDVKTINDIKRNNEIDKNIRFYLIDPDNDNSEFNYLCVMYNSLENKRHVHKLKNDNDEKWIWQQTYSEIFYIPRILDPIFILNSSVDRLTHPKSNDFVIFFGLEEHTFLQLLKKIGIKHFEKNCIIVSDYETGRDLFSDVKKNKRDLANCSSFSKFSEKNFQGKNWHLIYAAEEENDLRLIWFDSVGNIEQIRRAAVCRLSPLDFLMQKYSDIFNPRIIVLADEPGIGKSSSLLHFAKLQKTSDILKTGIPKPISMYINLNEFQNLFSENSEKTKRSLVQLLLATQKCSKYKQLVENILSFKLEQSDQVCLLCDAFDEMNIENQNNFLEWIEYILEQTKASVWITSRLNCKEKIEDALSVLSRSFEDIKLVKMYSFLTDFWKNTMKFSGKNPNNFDFSIAAKKVIDRFEPLFKAQYSYSFIRTPLILRILAEKYIDVMKEVLIHEIENDELLGREICKIKLFDAYEAFVLHKYEIYFQKMGFKDALDEDSKLILKNCYSEAYGYMAAIWMFVENPFSNRFEELHGTLYKIGLVQKYEDFVYEIAFIHPSFIEYFATELMCKMLKYFPNYESLLNTLVNEILWRPFSSLLFENKLEENNLSEVFNDRRSKDFLYNLLSNQAKSETEPAVLWKAAQLGHKLTVRFLLKCVTSDDKLKEIMRLPAETDLKTDLELTETRNYENLDIHFEICLKHGPPKAIEREDKFFPSKAIGKNLVKLANTIDGLEDIDSCFIIFRRFLGFMPICSPVRSRKQ